MANRIWEGKCEDCYKTESDLTFCQYPLVPEGFMVELCEKCIQSRTRVMDEGGEIPEVGLLTRSVWKDAPPLNFRVSGKELVAQIKFSPEGDHMGIARLRFDDRPQWFPCGVFCNTPAGARSDAKGFIRMHYFPGAPIQYS